MAMAMRHFFTVANSFLLLWATCEGTVPNIVEPSPGGSFVESVEVPQASSAGGVPASLYVWAITSLPSHYRGALGALDEHLAEEHGIFSAESPEVLRPHLCCADYSDGPAFKSALTAAAARHGGGGSVRSALNRPEGYCALAHVSSATAARVESEVLEGARCSPLTHASKEPTSLLAPGSEALGGDPQEGDLSVFGMKLGVSLQDGAERGLVVTMSPGALPLDKGDREQQDEESDGEGRKLRGADGAARSRSQSAVSEALQRRWKSVWNSASAQSGIDDFSEAIPWTSSKRRRENSGIGRRLDAPDAVGNAGGVRGEGSSPSYHGAKIAGYKAALAHLGRKMEDGAAGQGSGLSLMEACGWGKMAFVHGRNDVLYLRGIHDERHDEETGAACFLALVGFLSSQPDVLHIHPEAKVEANNKILTAYVEGGEELETPIREVGLNGTGEVIGITDTGLDDNSCFFRDDVHGMVPRTTMSEAAYYPEQRKVVQYLEFADDLDGDGHGTHVAGIACGQIYGGWEDPWEVQVSPERCEDVGLNRSCFGDCISEMVADPCRWNPELSCPMSDCDSDVSCDDQTGYPFPCFDDPEEELPAASGMAPGAKLSFFDIGLPDGGLILPNDLSEMLDAQHVAGARVYSNSWSLVTQNEPTDRDLQIDEWLYDNPDSLVVFGAGNNGFEDGSFQPKSVQSPATSKTVVTVGCSNSGPDRAYAYYNSGGSGYDGVMSPGEDVVFKVSPYSARGPVGFFTAKPDVIAPGLMVHSAKASRSEFREETCALESYGGTSMSAPAIAGAAAIVRQYFSQGMLAEQLENAGLCDGGPYVDMGDCDAFEPTGFLVKAVLVNSAVWLGNLQTMSYEGEYEAMTVLDFAQGFGAVQLASGLLIADSLKGGFYHEGELMSDKRYYYLIYVQDPDEDFSMTVAWYDPPASVSSYNLLHDLDSFAYSMSSGTYYRPNLFNTLMAMCGTDEACANKYEYTFANSLADDLNSVERTVIPSDELEEGYYVLAVRARILTESETQTYGLAVTGGGLVVHHTASSWASLGAETQSATGDWNGGDEPDPDGELGNSSSTHISTPSPSLVNSTAVEGNNATSATPAPSQSPLNVTGAAASSGYSSNSSDVDSSSGESESESKSETGSDSETSLAAHPAVGGDADSTETGAGGSVDDGGFEREVVDRNHDSSPQTTVIIAASISSAAALTAIVTCLVLRRRKDVHMTGRLTDICGRSFIRVASAKISDGDSVTTFDDVRPFTKRGGAASTFGPDDSFRFLGGKLPGYDTAIRLSGDPRDLDENERMVRSGGQGGNTDGCADGEEEGPDGMESIMNAELSGFYAAVDPSAVAKLVGWGIGRDFARVALRQTDNDIPAALRMIAKGDMDAKLALDLEQIARQNGSDAKVNLSAAPGH